MANIGQVDMKEITRRYGEEEAVRLMGEVIKNNEIIIKTQKQLEELLAKVEKKKWQKDKETERRKEREQCYESRLKGLSQETTLVLSNTRELNRVPNTK